MSMCLSDDLTEVWRLSSSSESVCLCDCDPGAKRSAVSVCRTAAASCGTASRMLLQQADYPALQPGLPDSAGISSVSAVVSRILFLLNDPDAALHGVCWA